jgi:hypothetical protein
MNKTRLSRIVPGVIIIFIGVGALLDALNVIDFWSFFGVWWPVLLIIGGVMIIFGNVARGDKKQ